jgi:hypothetical protein
MKEAYRLLRVRDGKPTTLFHGFEGSKVLPLDADLRAVEKPVHNPGKRNSGSPGFISGWHVLPTKEECVDYLGRFTAKEDIVVCRVEVAATRDKPRSKVSLSRWMRIRSEDWQQALEEYGYV